MKKMIKNTGYSSLDIVNRYAIPMHRYRVPMGYRYRVPMGYRYHVPMGYRYRVVEPAAPPPLWVPALWFCRQTAAPLDTKKRDQGKRVIKTMAKKRLDKAESKRYECD